MRIADAWRVVVAAALSGALMGCSATGKPLIGASAPSLKREDKSLRAAVEKDPFPRAQGLTAAGKS